VGPTALFIIFVVLIAAALVAVWRYWINLARVSPEEEEYDEQVSALNDRQANRLSDDVLTNPLSDEDAWQIMVRRGKRLSAPKRRGKRQAPPKLLPRRRERYGGELSRRVEERRDRSGEPPRRGLLPRPDAERGEE
jgi:hypothetical protein